MPETRFPALTVGGVFNKETLTNGSPDTIRCIEVGGQVFSISHGPVKVVALEDEWYEDLKDPQAVVAALKSLKEPRLDLFTFWQRLPDVTPRYPYQFETEDIAVLEIDSYEQWWTRQIKSRVRNQIRKAEKAGVVIKEVQYDDEFVRGMTSIFNESPIRQGRRFWHYGKDFETIKQQFSRYIFREQMIGAYYQGEMIGFMMLADAGRFALTGQIISSLKHRDKSPNNALIAKAVELCASRGVGRFVYLFWGEDSLAEFKRRCGFVKVGVPRYYVPLNWRGALALKAGVHRGLRAMLPKELRSTLKRVRGAWYERISQ